MPQRESGTNLLLVTSYEPCTMEEGLALAPVCSVVGEVMRLPIKVPGASLGEQPKAVNSVNHVLRPGPLAASSAQRKVLDGGPMGLRGEWKKANRGGFWPGKDAGVIGPVPAGGGTVELELMAEGFDDQGNSVETTVEISLDNGPSLATLVIPAHGEGESPATVKTLLSVGDGLSSDGVTRESATREGARLLAGTGDRLATGVYRFKGQAVIHSVTIAPTRSLGVSYSP